MLIGQHGSLSRDIKTIHRARDAHEAIGVEALHKGSRLMLKVTLDLPLYRIFRAGSSNRSASKLTLKGCG